MVKPLSVVYDSSIKVIEQLDELPPAAKSFRNMCDVLGQRGVKWTSYARVQSQNLRGSGSSGWKVISGLQATGNYKGQPVVIETKVGVRKDSSGYMYQFGSDPSATTTSSGQTIQRILNKIDRFEGKQSTGSGLAQRIKRQAKRGETTRNKQDELLRKTGVKHPQDFHSLAAKQLSIEDEEGEQDEL